MVRRKNSSLWRAERLREQAARAKEIAARRDELLAEMAKAERAISLLRGLRARNHTLLLISALVTSWAFTIPDLSRWMRTPLPVMAAAATLQAAIFTARMFRLRAVRRHYRQNRYDWPRIIRLEKQGVLLAAFSVFFASVLFFHTTGIGVFIVSRMSPLIPDLAHALKALLSKLLDVALGGIIGNAAYDYLKRRLARVVAAAPTDPSSGEARSSASARVR